MKYQCFSAFNNLIVSISDISLFMYAQVITYVQIRNCYTERRTHKMQIVSVQISSVGWSYLLHG